MAEKSSPLLSLAVELENYSKVMDDFIETANQVVLSQEVYKDGWSAKEIIAHIVYWHEYYVTILEALAKSEEPPVMKGSAHKNDAAIPMAAHNSLEQLLKRLLSAHQKYLKYIVLVKQPRIPYTKGAKDYSPSEYVRVIADHISRHTHDLHKAVRK